MRDYNELAANRRAGHEMFGGKFAEKQTKSETKPLADMIMT